MKAPVITLASNFHHDTSVVSLGFEKNFGIIGQELPGHKSSKTTEIYTHDYKLTKK